MSFAWRLFDSVFNAIVAVRLPNTRTGYLFVSAPSSIFLRLSQQTLLQMHLSSEEVSAISFFNYWARVADPLWRIFPLLCQRRLQLDFKASERFEAAVLRLFARYPSIENFLTVCVNLPRSSSTWDRSLVCLWTGLHTNTHTHSQSHAKQQRAIAVERYSNFIKTRDMSAKAHFAFGVSLEIFIQTNETAKCISIDFSRLKLMKWIQPRHKHHCAESVCEFFFKPLIHFIFFRIIVAVSFPFPPTAVYFLTSWRASFRSTRSAGAFVRVCERACNALARPHARNPGVREWHAADTQQERSAHFPTASPPKQGAETRQEWRGRLSVAAWRCQSRAGEPKIAVITWSAADTHCDVCVWKNRWVN